MSKLTDKQEMFCREYLIDLNATQAAIRAGYKEDNAKQTAYENLAKPYLQERIAELKAKRVAQVDIDAAYVLKRHYEIDTMDVTDILSDDGSVLPIREWPKTWRQYISGFDLSELFEGTGKDREQVGLLKKIKWPDKVKNLELLGKHVDVQAYNNKIDHTSSDGSMKTYSPEEYAQAEKRLGGMDLD
jgi:phage terminase small subunit